MVSSAVLTISAVIYLVTCQYIFVNMFTGVVVENFSYVFQTTGGAKSITREEVRAFKQVWAQFANQQTGFLERSQFGRFFHVCSTAAII